MDSVEDGSNVAQNNHRHLRQTDRICSRRLNNSFDIVDLFNSTHLSYVVLYGAAIVPVLSLVCHLLASLYLLLPDAAYFTEIHGAQKWLSQLAERFSVTRTCRYMEEWAKDGVEGSQLTGYGYQKSDKDVQDKSRRFSFPCALAGHGDWAGKERSDHGQRIKKKVEKIKSALHCWIDAVFDRVMYPAKRSGAKFLRAPCSDQLSCQKAKTLLLVSLQRSISSLGEVSREHNTKFCSISCNFRGMMYYRKTLMLQSYLDRVQSEDPEGLAVSSDIHFELYPEARAQADLKFTYVVTCQIYGMQKAEGKPEALQRNEALRVVYIDVVESVKNGKPST
ncbi:hypothetical protein ACP4OV_014342 [Aristida adscensionis]